MKTLRRVQSPDAAARRTSTARRSQPRSNPKRAPMAARRRPRLLTPAARAAATAPPAPAALRAASRLADAQTWRRAPGAGGLAGWRPCPPAGLQRSRRSPPPRLPRGIRTPGAAWQPWARPGVRRSAVQT
eukprot:scaffold16609_cov92-Isochrysis_galbana.AAC.2